MAGRAVFFSARTTCVVVSSSKPVQMATDDAQTAAAPVPDVVAEPPCEAAVAAPAADAQVAAAASSETATGAAAPAADADAARKRHKGQEDHGGWGGDFVSTASLR